MPSLKTEITEITTGLATLGYPSLHEALAEKPAQLLNVEDAVWSRICAAESEGNYAKEFADAWHNGIAFLTAVQGLRGRVPLRVEWKGPFHSPGYDQIPADLRIDHVYLVSCKYISKVLYNASPSHLFDRLLGDRRSEGSIDWYQEIAPTQYKELYAVVRSELSVHLALPASIEGLKREHRNEMVARLRGAWSSNALKAYNELCSEVSAASAMRWSSHLSTRDRCEEMLWRLLRLAPASYFILGSSSTSSMRLLIQTPWEWRRKYEFVRLVVEGDSIAGQPLVRWEGEVRDKSSHASTVVRGHVEIRWSHGRFGGNPEAKVYLDTPHGQVPCYVPL